jgi:phenylpyruvate tautomerase PptA (4-oxalocrotonate tautomerase family)
MPLVPVSAIAGKLSSEKKKKICEEMHDIMMPNTQSPSEAV